MKYPKYNKKVIDDINKKKLDCFNEIISNSITFDNKENELGLSVKDIELLSWNISTCLILLTH